MLIALLIISGIINVALVALAINLIRINKKNRHTMSKAAAELLAESTERCARLLSRANDRQKELMAKLFERDEKMKDMATSIELLHKELASAEVKLLEFQLNDGKGI